MTAGALNPARLLGRVRRRMLESAATTLCFAAGLGMIAFGVTLASLPAGFIVGGIELAATAILYERGRGS
jgi:hypothetical protein